MIIGCPDYMLRIWWKGAPSLPNFLFFMVLFCLLMQIMDRYVDNYMKKFKLMLSCCKFREGNQAKIDEVLRVENPNLQRRLFIALASHLMSPAHSYFHSYLHIYGAQSHFMSLSMCIQRDSSFGTRCSRTLFRS